VTPARLAAIHALCFDTPRPWAAREFETLLNMDTTFLIPHADTGFALGRVVVDEVELLTLAVHPDHHRHGIARALLDRYEQHARNRQAITSFLEVADTNRPAIRLYLTAGYIESGKRPRYYQTPAGTTIDAILFRKHL
jgi:ribosomal-protein-alanine N-acetyltransferase